MSLSKRALLAADFSPRLIASYVPGACVSIIARTIALNSTSRR